MAAAQRFVCSFFQDRSRSGRCCFADGLQERANRPRRGIRTDDSAASQDPSPHISRARFVTACALCERHRFSPFRAGSGKVAKIRHASAALWNNAMSHPYQAIGWNRQKRVYDLVVLAGVMLYIALFIGLGALLFFSLS